MQKVIFLISVALFTGKFCFAQIGGQDAFQFLNLPNSAKIAALGGTMPLNIEKDISSTFQNPSLLNSENNNTVSFNYCNYISDINFGTLQYNFGIKKHNFSTALMYVNYGNFEETQANGTYTGNNFSGGDYLLNLGYGNNWKQKIYYGANIKGIYSAYDIYNAFAIATDISATYIDSIKKFSAGVQFKNIGYQLKAFNQQKENLPFEMMVSIAKKLKYAPLRYHITYRNLQKFKSSYTSENIDENSSTETPSEELKFGDQLIRHLVLGGEFLFSETFHVQAAYNFQKAKELSIEESNGLSGFSAGFSLHLSKISFSYAHSRLNAVGGNNYFSVQIQPSIFVHKK